MPPIHLAIANVETLCEWLEEKMFNANYPSRRAPPHSDVEPAPGNSPTTGLEPT